MENDRVFMGIKAVQECLAELQRHVREPSPLRDEQMAAGLAGLSEMVAEWQAHESEQFARSALDGLSAEIAVLDGDGGILAVNQAWRRFSYRNGPVLWSVSEGANYLHVCDAATGDDAAEAKQAAAGIRDVAADRKSVFTLEYPCHSLEEQRWFNLRVTRYPGDGPARVLISHEDITERKQAEEALRKSEERFRQAVDHIPGLFVIYDAERRYLFVNAHVLRVSGLTAPDILGHRDEDLFPTEVTDAYLPALRQTVETRMPQTREATLALPSGPLTSIFHYVPLLDEQGNIYQILGITHDITERKRAERVARGHATALARTLSALASLPEPDAFLGQVLIAITEQLHARLAALWFYNAAQDCLSCHMTCEDGQIGQGEQTGHPVSAEPIPAAKAPLWQDLLRTRRPVLIEDIPQPDEEGPQPLAGYRWLKERGIQTLLAVPLPAGDGLLGWLSIYSPERRRYQPEEIELAEVLAQQATLALQLTQLAEQGRQAAVLNERNRMAREIHDTLAQGFTGIVLQLEAAEETLAEEPEAAQAHITRARDLARQSLAEARRSVHALRPQALEHETLATALQSLARQMTSGTSVRSVLDVQGTPHPLPPDVEHNLLRIGVEALTNALKHAQAGTIRICLAFDSKRARLSVQDDGMGFDPHQPRKNGGFGLTSMWERAEHIGAALTVTSQPGLGTEVAVIVPSNRLSPVT